MISLIVAMDQRNLIGKNNELPWYIPKDLKRFKELTTGGVVVMGRKTSESILARIGTPLPGRISVVVTRDSAYTCEGAVIANSLEHAMGNARLFGGREIWIIGGAEIYRQALAESLPDRLVITRIDGEYEGDAYFPPIPPIYRLASTEPGGEYWSYETWEKIG
jgi:dihydrofolate reductase